MAIFYIKDYEEVAGVISKPSNRLYVHINDDETEWRLFDDKDENISSGSFMMSTDMDFIKSISELEKLEELNNSGFPSEDEVIDTIMSCVDIRGIDLEHYRRNFTDKECGLYSKLVELFKKEQNG